MTENRGRESRSPDVKTSVLKRRSLLVGVGAAAVATTGAVVFNALSAGSGTQPKNGPQPDPNAKTPIIIREPNEPPRTVLTQFQQGNGFQVSGSALGSVDETSDYVMGSQSVYFETKGDGGQTMFGKPSAISAGLDMSGKIFAILVKVTGSSHLTKFALLAGDSGFKSYFQFMIQASPTIPSQEIFPDGRWSWVTLPWGPSSAGRPNRANVTDLRIFAEDDSTGNRVKIQVQAIAVQQERPLAFPDGVVSISFDDCWGSQKTYGTSYLDKYGFQPTIYTIVDQVGRPGRLSLADLHRIEEKGGEVAAHAWTAANHNKGFTNLSSDVLDAELKMTKEWLLENNFRGADLFAYPLGTFNSMIIDAASRYYKFARTLNNRQEETLPPGEMHTCRAQSSTNTVTLAHLQDRIDSCQANGTWLNLVFHDITTATPSASVQIAESTFRAAIDYIARKQIPVQITSQILSQSV